MFYSVKIGFLAKKSLSESDKWGVLAVISKLLEKNKRSFDFELRFLEQGIDGGTAAPAGTWKRMDRNQAKIEEEQAQRLAEEDYDRQMKLMERDYFFSTPLPENAKIYAKEKAAYISLDDKIKIESTLEDLIDRLPNILQNNTLLFSWEPNSGIMEVSCLFEEEGYRGLGTIFFEESWSHA